MNFFHHKDLGNHLLQLCPKVVKHPVYPYAVSLTPFMRRKPQYIFQASVRPQPHSGICIWVPSFWTRRTSGCQEWGPSGTLLKEQDSYNLVQNMGHKGPVLRPRCIGPGRARTQILFYSSNTFQVLLSKTVRYFEFKLKIVPVFLSLVPLLSCLQRNSVPARIRQAFWKGSGWIFFVQVKKKDILLTTHVVKVRSARNRKIWTPAPNFLHLQVSDILAHKTRGKYQAYTSDHYLTALLVILSTQRRIIGWQRVIHWKDLDLI